MAQQFNQLDDLLPYIYHFERKVLAEIDGNEVRLSKDKKSISILRDNKIISLHIKMLRNGVENFRLYQSLYDLSDEALAKRTAFFLTSNFKGEKE